MPRNPNRKPDPARHLCTYEGCKGAFRSPSELTVHLRRHTGEKPFKCDHEGCQMEFVCAGDLTDHQRCHTGAKPYRCNQDGCTASFAKAGNLTIHMRMHAGDKPFVCKHCPQSFSHASNLTKHERSHSGDKPFACDVEGCMMAFSHSPNLKRHKDAVHSSHRPFPCNLCPLAFAQEVNLVRHKRRHTGERPYRCTYEECSAAFSGSSDLTNHVALHTSGGIRRRKTKEAKVEKAFADNGIDFCREFQVDFGAFSGDSGKQFARIDFFVDKDGGYLLVEIDEYQHDGYAAACEARRMQEVFGMLSASPNTHGKKAAFIRFNPDEYCIDGIQKKLALADRIKVLVEKIKDWDFESEPLYGIQYMYFDSCNGRPDLFQDVSLDDCPENREFLEKHFVSCVV